MTLTTRRIKQTAVGAGLLFSAVLAASSTACIDADLGNELVSELIDSVQAAREEQGDNLGGDDAGDAAGRPAPGQGIQDGSSNTIAIGEQTPSGDGAVRDVPADGGIPASDPAGEVAPPDDPTSAPAPVTPVENADEALIADLTAQLGDKLMEFGSSSFFSSGSITESVLLETCAFGGFAMRVTRITATSIGDLSSEDFFEGTWSVALVDGQPVIVLNVERASDPADVGTRRVTISAGPNGELFLDGNPASVSDATADCAAAQP